MLEEVLPLSRQGFSILPLHPRQKRPVGDDWSTASDADLLARFEDGMNVGVRLGDYSKVGDLYTYVLDMDLRSKEPAAIAELKAAIQRLLPNWFSFPYVISGSGSGSRHVYFFSSGKFRSKKLAHSVEQIVDDEGRKHWAWEIELFGKGKQVAIPPSIHPSGRAYKWGRPIDFEDVRMGIGPEVAPDVVEAWGMTRDRLDGTKDGDIAGLTAAIRQEPKTFTDEEVDHILANLPADYIDDYHRWMEVGFALHHQYRGDEEAGLARWDLWSQQSDKYQARGEYSPHEKWTSFYGKENPVTMASLYAASKVNRLRTEIEGDDADDDTVAATDLFEEVPETDPVAREATSHDDSDLLGDEGGESEVDGLLEDDDKPSRVTPKSQRTPTEWMGALDVGDTGPKSTLHNLKLIIRNDPRFSGLAQENQLLQQMVHRRMPGRYIGARMDKIIQLDDPAWVVENKIDGDHWEDIHDAYVRSILEAPRTRGGYGMKVTDRDLREALAIDARRHAFHPIKEHLALTTWDGVPRIETFFIDYLGAPDSPYMRAVAEVMFIAAVTRINEPGHKFDFAVILEGPQGQRKSSFIKTLALDRWYGEIHGDMADRKLMVEQMQGHWLLELPEMVGVSKSEVNDVKAFIAASSDNVRLAYDKRARNFKRQSIFIGSTNDRKYLKDDTGNRRFWPVPVNVATIDTDAVEAIVDQVWAEAGARYREMRAAQPHGTLPLFLTGKAAQEEALLFQEQRRIETAEDAIAGEIMEWLETPVALSVLEGNDTGFENVDAPNKGDPMVIRTATCLKEVWVSCLKNDANRYGPPQAQLIGRAMNLIADWYATGAQTRFHGWGKQRLYRLKGSRGDAFYKPAPDRDSDLLG